MLQQELQQARIYIEQLHQTTMFKRLEYLFKVVEFERAFSLNNPDFVEDCMGEIAALMEVPKPELTEEK